MYRHNEEESVPQNTCSLNRLMSHGMAGREYFISILEVGMLKHAEVYVATMFLS